MKLEINEHGRNAIFALAAAVAMCAMAWASTYSTPPLRIPSDMSNEVATEIARSWAEGVKAIHNN